MDNIKYFLMIALVLLSGFALLNENSIISNLMNFNDVNSLQEPRQTRYNTSMVTTVFDTEVTLDCVAKYEITGRVVKLHKYTGTEIMNYLAPLDVGLSWGNLAIDENNNKMDYSMPGNRSIKWRCTDSNFVKNMGGENAITKLNSNNSLIPCDATIRNTLKSINEGDYIKIEGYLVNAYCQLPNEKYLTLNTSTSRTDTGSGSGEVIYVTNIEWLE